MSNSQKIMLEGVKLIFRNFAGAPDRYNKAGGQRNFSIILDEATAQDLLSKGLNVKPLKKRDEDEDQLYRLKVKVNMDSARPPRIVMLTDDGNGTKKTVLDENTVQILDQATILNADIQLAPWEWSVNGASGITVYLDKLYVTVELDPIQLKYELDGADEWE